MRVHRYLDVDLALLKLDSDIAQLKALNAIKDRVAGSNVVPCPSKFQRRNHPWKPPMCYDPGMIDHEGKEPDEPTVITLYMPDDVRENIREYEVLREKAESLKAYRRRKGIIE